MEVDDLAHDGILGTADRAHNWEGPMGNTINLKAADGFTLSAYTAGPAGATKGIVVIQEIFGVNHHMRDMADRFAAEGYAVCAPAIFDRAERGVELGYTPDDIAKGRDYRMKLDDAKVMADVEAAANHLAGKKLGIVGYCFGGTVAWWGATRTNKFAASSCWYGGGIAGTKDERPNCPVQMHFGEKDASIPMTDVEAVRAAQPKAESHVYMGAQHGFGCDERASFSKPDYELAQQRTLAFFSKLLG
jgi:carboxymethylenebutenolidase